MLTDIHFVHPFAIPIDHVQGCRKLEAISLCTKIHLVLVDRAVYGTTEFLKANCGFQYFLKEVKSLSTFQTSVVCLAVDEGDSMRCHFQVWHHRCYCWLRWHCHKCNTLLAFDAHHNTLLIQLSMETSTLLLSSHEDTTHGHTAQDWQKPPMIPHCQ